MEGVFVRFESNLVTNLVTIPIFSLYSPNIVNDFPDPVYPKNIIQQLYP
jgi:hypothetical protein